jgi:hypothetical protein
MGGSFLVVGLNPTISLILNFTRNFSIPIKIPFGLLCS